MSLTDEIIRILAEDMGPASIPFYNRVCQSMNKSPGSIGREDLDAFAGYAYAMVKRSLGVEVAQSLYDRILQLVKE